MSVKIAEIDPGEEAVIPPGCKDYPAAIGRPVVETVSIATVCILKGPYITCLKVLYPDVTSPVSDVESTIFPEREKKILSIRRDPWLHRTQIQ